MFDLALALVFCSAILHVTWNVKLQSEHDPLDTATKAVSLGVACLFPFILGYWFSIAEPTISWHALLFGFLSGVAELGYFFFLSYSYQRGELSVVYPIARGSAPVLSFAFGVLFLREHVGYLQTIGVICLLLGIWFVRGSSLRGTKGVLPAFVTGIFVASYTVIDKVGLSGTNPIIFGGLKYFFTALCLLALVPLQRHFGRRKAAKTEGRAGGKILLIGICIIATYQLVLFALTMAPVAIISPLRESASVMVTIWGIWKLKERDRLLPKLIGVVSILTGIGLLAA
jgi:uncharacterized membrane protein